MKKFLSENKNIIFVCTYVIVLLAVMLNYKVIIDYTMLILGLLKPLFYAIAIAFVLNIPMRRIEQGLNKILRNNKFLLRFIRTISILLTLIFATILLYLLVMIIIPKVSESMVEVFKGFPQLVNSWIRSVNKIFDDFNINFRLQDIAYIKELQDMSWQQIFEKGITFFGDITAGVIRNAMEFTNAFFQWFLAFCLSIYLLAGKEKFIYQIRKVILACFNLKHSHKIFRIGEKANYMFTKFVGGQLVDCAIKGIMFYIVFIILDFPLPELLATTITVCSIVPVFGPIFAMLIDFVLIFAFDPLQGIWFIVIFQILSNLESQIIYPKIVGKSIGLPGIWVLLSIFVLGDLFGVAGMLLAVPCTALAYELFGEYIDNRLKKKDIKVIVNDSGDLK
ncbi:putative PurR-regulated permease PerM [Breznakia sp. PF5-3]|uniref:AI-2E family transporter n=1 Tax=unclassified Breznakia TaxID=2623764 RepID=UPI002405BDBC|nr:MULTISPECIES: AI-2E family transporter [unclassified Breznakia]MDF9824154.1 putative PurR-regulated permease PerM [Breznakia sp. PM6-1]MDF9834952.1 putative PurR-regulated permease PerM [Breznakia sp. PF5-3]MDF9837179.1 putative PurR-regulated permease PerM [Breznakia sp. PFB2-8]MDF9859169.1 putative PurR-regulated permease PerM [Breznakia sp. PH5-24]